MLVPIAVWTLAILATGWIAGRRFEKAVRGWSDYRARKAEVPILRAAARLLSAKAAGAVLLAAAVATFALYALAVAGAQ